MQREVITLSPGDDVMDATQLLLRRGISGAPVVDQGVVVGMFSERDSLGVIAAAVYDAEPSGSVAQFMRRKFTAVTPDTDLFELCHAFEDYPIRRLPVVDHERRLLGLVTRQDALVALCRLYCTRARSHPGNAYERARAQLDA